MDGRDMKPGDIVTVLAVPAGLVKGLPDREREFLLSLVGDDVAVSDTGPDYVEIEAFDTAEGMTHFLRMAESDLSQVVDAGISPRGIR